ncbi:MAG: 3-deoxy-manno-octulosonate cytidylyltransferase [Bacteroidetes bacterium]|nr:3-deoxy-manno-octulosonate cytidylyltransferase [Bacteroidota bacterium]
MIAMGVVALIPARSESSRFPDKLLTLIRGKSVIVRAYESAVATNIFSEVIVVTDDDRIVKQIEAVGGKVIKSKPTHDSGLQRMAEASIGIDSDMFVHIQGNLPFVQKTSIEKLLQIFEGNAGKTIQAASIAQKIAEADRVNDTNCVKVTLDLRMSAIYFSRSPIPYLQNTDLPITRYEHVGIYAFRKQALLTFMEWARTPLERAEDIEALRFIENGVSIKMILNQNNGIEINVPDDIAKAEALMDKMGWQ